MATPTPRLSMVARLTKPLMLTRLMLWSARHLPDRTPQEVGLAYSDVEFDAADGVKLRGWFLPAGPEPGPAVVVVHVGQWHEMGEAYAAAQEWMAEHGVVNAGDPWETYFDGPEAPVHSTVLTFPCREA